MAIRRSYSAPAKSNEPTTFAGKYSLARKAGLEKVGNEAFVIPLDMSNGYVAIPYHTLKKCADGTGFRGSQYNVKIACHKFDKDTGEVINQAPLCDRIAQAEKDRIPEKEKSADRAMTFMSERRVMPVLVLSTTETDTSKNPSLKKVSIKSGVEFSYIDMSESAYDELAKSILEGLVDAGIIDSLDELSEEEKAEEVAKALQSSIIKITNVKGRSSNIKYERTYRAIPLSNPQVAKESNETKAIDFLTKVVNGNFPAAKLDALYEKAPVIKEINGQTLDFLELFNNEVDTLVQDWTDEELQSYYDSYLEKAGVVALYKSPETTSKATESVEDVSFDETPARTSSRKVEVVDDFDFAEEAKKEAASVAVAEKSEEDFDYSTSDLETSNILEDEDFAEDDFELLDGDDL